MERSGGWQISLQTLECCLTLVVPIEVSSILLNGEEEGLALINRSAEETVEGGKVAIENLDFLDRGRELHLRYGGYLVGAGFDSSLSDQIPEEFAGSYPKGTLLGIDLHIEFSEESECFLQVLHVVGAIEIFFQACHQRTPPFYSQLAH